jgi:hypothetical protein
VVCGICCSCFGSFAHVLAVFSLLHSPIQVNAVLQFLLLKEVAI